MKKLILTASAFVALAGVNAASAADMPLKAPPMMAPAGYNWSGFYIGGNAGYSWGRASSSFTAGGVPAPFSGSQNMDGWLGGGQIGYNWQGMGSPWIVGLEADLQGTGQRGGFTSPAVVTTPPPGVVVLPSTTSIGSLTEKLPWFGTVRGRLGFAAAPRWMLYVTGGLAYGEVRSTGGVSVATGFPGLPPIATAATSASINNDRAGWTIGGGAEWAIAGAWSAKAEYLYVDLGTISNTFAAPVPVPSIGASTRITDNIFRVGINYRLGGMARGY
jgi:outer membrane immunogenic protein